MRNLDWNQPAAGPNSISEKYQSAENAFSAVPLLRSRDQRNLLNLFNWPDANLKHLEWNCWYSSFDTNLLSAKKIFEYVKDLLYESTSLAPAQRPNIAVLIVRAKFSNTRILSDSVKCWRLLGNEDVVGSTLNSNLWKVKLLVVHSLLVPPVRYACNFYDPKTVGYFSHLTLCVGLRCIFMNLSWLQRVRNTSRWCSVKKVIEFGRDVLSKLLATTFKFVTSRAFRPKCIIIGNVCVCWTPLTFRLFKFYDWGWPGPVNLQESSEKRMF